VIIAGVYSFNGGKEALESGYGSELGAVKQIITAVDSLKHKTKISYEKIMPGRQLYSPVSLNKSFKQGFEERDWRNYRVMCEYSTQYYTADYKPSPLAASAFRDMDFVKNRVGIEIQFWNYASIISSVCAKMTIFNKLGVIDAGIEIVPVKDFAAEMSSGVSYFEQFVWDLEQRGVCNIDIPVLILGVAA